MKVTNMLSNKGNKVPNQFIIEGLPAGTYNKQGFQIKSGEMFQSYETNIVFKDYEGKVYLDAKYWNYSQTTSKYRNNFLNESTKETEAKIKSGEYELVNLN